MVCGLLFLATTINYMDRSALSLVEPILKHLLGGDQDLALYNRRYSDIVNSFILAYGLGFLVAGRVVDRIGVKKGYALAIGLWALASISHAFARTALGFGIARFAWAWASPATSLLRSKRPPTGFPPRSARWAPAFSIPEPAPER